MPTPSCACATTWLPADPTARASGWIRRAASGSRTGAWRSSIRRRAARSRWSSDGGRLAVTFNGEIYNFRHLRAALEAAGRRFRTASDTEVVLHLYDRHGRDMVEHLRGMFALAIWDRDRRGLLLARDGFGIKPLYYSDTGGTLRFASQVKALLAGGGVDTTPSPAGRAGFFVWGSVPEPWTFFDAIRCVPAGSTMWVDGHGVRPPAPWFDVHAELAHAAETPADRTREALRDAVRDTVRHHLVADVPVGAFLSAGLDSGTLVAHAAELAGPASGRAAVGDDGLRRLRGHAVRRGGGSGAGGGAVRHGASDGTARAPGLSGRLRGRPRGHGPAVHRRGEHLPAQPGGGADGVEGRPVGRGRRRVVRRLRQLLHRAARRRPPVAVLPPAPLRARRPAAVPRRWRGRWDRRSMHR